LSQNRWSEERIRENKKSDKEELPKRQVTSSLQKRKEWLLIKNF